ncbi:MAG: four helix bundle protein [Sulfurovum sp.]|jgi:four helix bundle protein|nr:four helix bundle protein [Sulfurovum sp.]
MSILAEKSYKFAIRIVKLNVYLKDEKKEYTLSKQLLRSGTAIGALVSEAQYAQSKADFINKLSIGLKEANESRYWIRLLKDCDYLNDSMANSIYSDAEELIKILTSSINTTKEKNNDHR